MKYSQFAIITIAACSASGAPLSAPASASPDRRFSPQHDGLGGHQNGLVILPGDLRRRGLYDEGLFQRSPSSSQPPPLEPTSSPTSPESKVPALVYQPTPDKPPEQTPEYDPNHLSEFWRPKRKPIVLNPINLTGRSEPMGDNDVMERLVNQREPQTTQHQRVGQNPDSSEAAANRELQRFPRQRDPSAPSQAWGAASSSRSTPDTRSSSTSTRSRSRRGVRRRGTAVFTEEHFGYGSRKSQ